MSDLSPEANFAAEDIRPRVASARSNRAIWIFGAAAAIAGGMLFQALEARRTAMIAPSVTAPIDAGSAPLASPPALFIPPEPALPVGSRLDWGQAPALPTSSQPQETITSRPAPTPRPRTSYRLTDVPSPSFQAPRDVPANTEGGAPAWTSPLLSRPAVADQSAQSSGKDRVQAVRFASPGTTVPKGTVVQAVLESALDSTRGGFARAIVSRDVYAFDGKKVLIQRGSRILGEYKSDISLGQKRILIQWQRLMRPDGVMVDLDSPSADPLGRAGVQGSVNTHFFERFAGAILQSSLDVGVQLAARAASRDTVVLALPGSVQQGTQIVQPEKIAPTVKVRQGSSVSVFVAKDLDFTDVEK